MRRTPLQVLLKSVQVESLASGALRVMPRYHGVDSDAGEIPGLFTRLNAARHVEKLLNAHLRGRK